LDRLEKQPTDLRRHHHYMRDGALDYPRQDENGGFRKTFVAIAVVHLVLLGGLLLATLHEPKQNSDSVVWMSPGSFAGDSTPTQAPLTDNRESAPPPNEEPNQPSPQEADQRDEPVSPPPATLPPLPTPLPAVEESALPISTPPPTASPRLTPTPTPRPTPTAKLTPKPSPKPTPKPTPKPSPAHSVTPKPSPKPEAVPKEKDKEKPKVDDAPKPKTSPVKSEEKEKANSSPAPGARQAEAGHSKGKLTHDQTTPGPGDSKVAGSGDSALAAYVGILTNRFQAAWNQPTSEMALGKTLEVTVKLKVEADGAVTEFTIVEGSGNAVVDDSVRDAGKKITKLPPPPNGQAFSAPVRFELGN
jgi:TonB family protein